MIQTWIKKHRRQETVLGFNEINRINQRKLYYASYEIQVHCCSHLVSVALSADLGDEVEDIGDRIRQWAPSPLEITTTFNHRVSTFEQAK